MSLRVLSISGAATLQGQQKTGRRHFGVPYGGPWDRQSHGLANALVGNETDCTALELPLYGGLFECIADVRIAVVGAVGAVLVNGYPSSPNAAYTLKQGDRIEVGAYAEGSVAYLSAPGGWAGLPGTNVTRGMELLHPDLRAFSKTHIIKLDQPPTSLSPRVIRVINGPQYTNKAEAPGTKHLVLAERSRVGTRLSGIPLDDFKEIASEPACWGALQITPNGERILIGPDGPTIGGYPKIAVAIDADLDRIAQLREGETVEFKFVSYEKAVVLSTTAAHEFDKKVSWIRTLAR